MNSNEINGENEKLQKEFAVVCEKGDVELAQTFYLMNNDNFVLTFTNEMFLFACRKNQMEMAKWIYSHEKINVHVNSNEAMWNACNLNHLDMAKWLYSLGNSDCWELSKFNNILLRNAKAANYVELSEWLEEIIN